MENLGEKSDIEKRIDNDSKTDKIASRILGNWLDSYIDLTDYSEPTIQYRRWCALSAIAACLKRECYVELDINIYPNMFIVLVGPSGTSGKGTAMGPSQAMLNAVGISLSANSTTREALILELIAIEKNPTTNGAEPSASLTIFSLELVTLISRTQSDLLAALTDWYDCSSPWTYSTIKRGRDTIKNICLNLIGAITPLLLTTCLPSEAIGGGFASRVIFVYAASREKRKPRRKLTSSEKKLSSNLVHDLCLINKMHGEFIFTEEAKKYYDKWYLDIDDSKGPLAGLEKFSGYLSRKATHVLKVAMTLSAARSSDFSIELGDIKKADIYLTELEFDLPKAFLGRGETPEGVINKNIEDYIKEQGEVLLSSISAKFSFTLSGMAIKEALLLSEKSHNIRAINIKKTETTPKDILITWIGLGDKSLAG